jgi:ribonuclease VapC
MVIDTSAIIAILQSEPGSNELVAILGSANAIRVSTATLVEAGLVMQARYGDEGEVELDRLLKGIGAMVMPVTEEHAMIARDAYRRYGKGRHPAALNYGDCFSYALAIAFDEPLLHIGADFGRTDVKPAP